MTIYYFKIVIWLNDWLLHLKSNQITILYQVIKPKKYTTKRN